MIFLRFWEDLGGPEAIKRCFPIGFLEFLKMPENQGSIWGSKSTKSIGVDAKTERAWGAGTFRGEFRLEVGQDGRDRFGLLKEPY